MLYAMISAVDLFLSTPSARRATIAQRLPRSTRNISIHALREEGDSTSSGCASGSSNFYPRPPRGGRPPSVMLMVGEKVISIHALREEGDLMPLALVALASLFLSTPSARRATPDLRPACSYAGISIHALREEGDVHKGHPRRSLSISIHALREEGDGFNQVPRLDITHFYPRPPRGGRR